MVIFCAIYVCYERCDEYFCLFTKYNILFGELMYGKIGKFCPITMAE